MRTIVAWIAGHLVDAGLALFELVEPITEDDERGERIARRVLELIECSEDDLSAVFGRGYDDDE